MIDFSFVARSSRSARCAACPINFQHLDLCRPSRRCVVSVRLLAVEVRHPAILGWHGRLRLSLLRLAPASRAQGVHCWTSTLSSVFDAELHDLRLRGCSLLRFLRLRRFVSLPCCSYLRNVSAINSAMAFSDRPDIDLLIAFAAALGSRLRSRVTLRQQSRATPPTSASPMSAISVIVLPRLALHVPGSLHVPHPEGSLSSSRSPRAASTASKLRLSSATPAALNEPGTRSACFGPPSSLSPTRARASSAMSSTYELTTFARPSPSFGLLPPLRRDH